MSDIAEYDALVARIETTGLPVFDSVRTDPKGALVRDLYVIAYPTTPYLIESNRHTAAARATTTRHFDLDVRVIAPTARGAALGLSKVIDAVLDGPLLVPGRKCDPATLDQSSAAERDSTVTPPLFYADAGFELISRPGGTP